MKFRSIARYISDWLISVKTSLLLGEPFFWLLGLRSIRNKIDIGQIRRILVTRIDEIGDMILTTPFLRELRNNTPSAWITLVVSPKVYNLVEHCPYVDEILTYDGSLGKGSLKEKLLRRLRTLGFAYLYLLKRRFDLAILPRWFVDFYDGSFLIYFSGAKKRIAYTEYTSSYKSKKNKNYDKLFTHIINDATIRHEVQNNLKIINFLGGEVSSDNLEVWINDNDRNLAQSILTKKNIKQENFLIGIGPGSRVLRKQWPVERFLELINWLLNEIDTRIILFGDKNEACLGQYIAQYLKKDFTSRVMDLVGKATLRQTAAFLTHCKLYIGNDTGLIHIASAVKVPIIEISSWAKSASPRSHFSSYFYTPWKTQSIIVNPDEPTPPCREYCVFHRPHCILQVRVEDVKEAVRGMLALIQ